MARQALLLFVVLTATALCPDAQTHPPATPANATAAGAKLTFDAASVRISSQKFFLKGWDFLDPVSNAPPPPGGLFSWNVQIGSLIYFAYDIGNSQVRREVWEALPKGTNEQWYAIEARADGNPTRADVRQMVRSLLEERFQFAGHPEKREAQVFSLEVAKPGLGLKPHSAGAPCELPAALTDEKKYPHAYPPYKTFSPHCGAFNRELSRSGERRLEMLDATMQQIADSLSQGLPMRVVDHTGLTGHYDAVVDFGPNGVPQNPDASDEIGLPPLPSAIEKQLGLKLVKQTAQVDTFIVDHIGPLSEN